MGCMDEPQDPLKTTRPRDVGFKGVVKREPVLIVSSPGGASKTGGYEVVVSERIPEPQTLFGYPIEFVDMPELADTEPLELFGQYGTLTATNRRTGEQVVADVILLPGDDLETAAGRDATINRILADR